MAKFDKSNPCLRVKDQPLPGACPEADVERAKFLAKWHGRFAAQLNPPPHFRVYTGDAALAVIGMSQEVLGKQFLAWVLAWKNSPQACALAESNPQARDLAEDAPELWIRKDGNVWSTYLIRLWCRVVNDNNGMKWAQSRRQAEESNHPEVRESASKRARLYEVATEILRLATAAEIREADRRLEIELFGEVVEVPRVESVPEPESIPEPTAPELESTPELESLPEPAAEAPPEVVESEPIPEHVVEADLSEGQGIEPEPAEPRSKPGGHSSPPEERCKGPDLSRKAKIAPIQVPSSDSEFSFSPPPTPPSFSTPRARNGVRGRKKRIWKDFSRKFLRHWRFWAQDTRQGGRPEPGRSSPEFTAWCQVFDDSNPDSDLCLHALLGATLLARPPSFAEVIDPEHVSTHAERWAAADLEIPPEPLPPI